MREVITQVNNWAKHSDRTRIVSFTNVHMIVEAALRPAFKKILNGMDLNCPDGAPIFWLVSRNAGTKASKISGPEFMPRFCEQSVELGLRHFLYGGGPNVAKDASATLFERYPGIQIVGSYCPPFHKLNDEEQAEVVATINSSGADVVWVCLGCPKQEIWMHEMRDRLDAKVLLAVGQAFDILAGRTHRAPEFMSRNGVEWLYRLAKNPRRLWKRYLVTNLLFLLLVARTKLKQKQAEPVFGGLIGKKVADE
jgi:N-acetylglucosaminyldiphosphoundecaprenol N-acetyl-beta-D-mannosaminyltransferase